MSRPIIAALILVLLTPLPAYGKSPEDARKDLEKLNIPYTSTEFRSRAKRGDAAAVGLFLDAGMNPNARNEFTGVTALIWAANEGHTDIAKALLAKGADVNVKDILGITALMAAAQNGHVEAAEALLAKGADVNAKDNDGETALMAAALEGHTDFAEALLSKGADVNAKDNDGETALTTATIKGHTDFVQLLKSAGAEE